MKAIGEGGGGGPVGGVGKRSSTGHDNYYAINTVRTSRTRKLTTHRDKLAETRAATVPGGTTTSVLYARKSIRSINAEKAGPPLTPNYEHPRKNYFAID